jgi:hypothetical protein
MISTRWILVFQLIRFRESSSASVGKYFFQDDATPQIPPDHPINELPLDLPLFQPGSENDPQVQFFLNDPFLANHPAILRIRATSGHALPILRDPNQPGGLRTPEPIRAPRPPREPPHLGPLTARNRENIPRDQLRELERRQDDVRRAAIARRTQLPTGAAAPAAVISDIAALGRVGRGGLPNRNALVELEPRPDGRRRFRAMEDEEQNDENENRAAPTPLNRREECMLAGGREDIVPLATPGGIRAENNPNIDDLNPMDTGLPVDPLQRVVIGFRR